MLKRYSPFQVLFFGFITAALGGTLVLMTPFASATQESQSFVDALFTATSAVTTTGLVVVDTGSYYSLFGQAVILLLFQVGGLGYMIFIAVALSSAFGRLPIATKMILHESLSRPTYFNAVEFSKIVISYTLFLEITCAILMSSYWIKFFPLHQAIFLGLFHSVSTFCTAGFGLFSDSFMSYRTSIFFNILIAVESFAGCIGFFVIYDLRDFIKRKLSKQKRPVHLATHTRLALTMASVLILSGMVIIFFSDFDSTGKPMGEKILETTFQAISASTTTGFNTIDIGLMSTTGLFAIIILMLIGASTGGTGGGIKTTTFGVLLISVYSLLVKRKVPHIFKRSIPVAVTNNALVIGSIAVVWMTLSVLLLTVTEGGKIPFLRVAFEAASAFGTVGLSTGITASLSTAGKLVICLSMLIGRVGPLTIGLSLLGKQKPPPFKYATADILVG